MATKQPGRELRDPFNCCGGNDEKPPHHCSDCSEHPWQDSPDPRCMAAPATCPHAQPNAPTFWVVVMKRADGVRFWLRTRHGTGVTSLAAYRHRFSTRREASTACRRLRRSVRDGAAVCLARVYVTHR